MDKCICFNRVSTVSQDIEQQKDIVYNECIKDGFLPENIIIISHKESAIKLSIQEREGIQELMNYINTDPNITSVYVYEISRISRQAKMLYEIRDFLIEKHIQLIVLKPYLKLLDIDGNISQAASILFSIFTSIIMFFFDFNPITKVFSFYPEYNFNNTLYKIHTNNLNFNTLLLNIQFLLQFIFDTNVITINDNKFTLTIIL